MTVKEILDFCEKREVEIYTCYNFICDSLIVKMRKKGSETTTVISRREATFAGFVLTIRIILRQMADELDRDARSGREPEKGGAVRRERAEIPKNHREAGNLRRLRTLRQDL